MRQFFYSNFCCGCYLLCFTRISDCPKCFRICVVFAFVGMIVTRFLFYKLVNFEQLKRRILVIGSGQKAEKLISINDSYIHKGFTIVGFIALPDETSVVDESQLISSDKNINDVAEEYNVDEIVIALDDKRRMMPVDELLDCKMSGMTIMDMMAFYERERGLSHWKMFTQAGWFSPMVLRKVA